MRIGIIGGGQLGMMLAEAAEKHHHQVFVLEPKKNPSTSHTKSIIIPYRYEDPQGLELLYLNSDVIIYEFENIGVEHLKKYVHKIPQGIKALEISQDRMAEKVFAKSLGIPTPQFISINQKDDLKNAFYPSILKTTRLGYDGKGQYKLTSFHDTENIDIDQPMILEEYIPFDYEISVVLTRDMYHQIAFLPIIKNQHVNGILDTSFPLWDGYDHVRDESYHYAKLLVEKLDYVGTFAIEFFVKDNHVIFNEMAPRPHNSGHFSIEGATISQFENMILAVTHQHVIKPDMTKKSLMINVLGQHQNYALRAKRLNDVFIHDYYKEESLVNRKMAHITCCADSDDQLFSLEKIIKGELHG